MALHFLASVNNPIRTPDGKITAIFFAQLGEVRWFDDEIGGHDTIALPVFPMADGAVSLILEFPTGNDFTFLCQAREGYNPEQGCGHKSSEAFLLRPSFCLSNDFALP
jgi:hypothetical protein